MGSSLSIGHRLALAVLLLVLLLPVLALLGFFTVGAVLAAPASAPGRADLVVVLGGDDGVRYARGRELVLAGLGSRLMLINPSEKVKKDVVASLPGTELLLDDAPRSTWEEAQAVRRLMLNRGFKTVLVVSDPPHMLRLRYSWSSQLRGTDMSYTLVATSPAWWPGWRWWSDPDASKFVGNEVLKLGYYVVRYRFGFF